MRREGETEGAREIRRVGAKLKAEGHDGKAGSAKRAGEARGGKRDIRTGWRGERPRECMYVLGFTYGGEVGKTPTFVSSNETKRPRWFESGKH